MIQIPKFVAEGNNPAVDTLNEEIQKNQGEVYNEWKDAQDPVRGLEIKSYLFTSEDYVQAWLLSWNSLTLWNPWGCIFVSL